MRALVVDDSRAIRGIIAKIMRSLDFETVEACNGREAIESLRQDHAFDVVTVNWEMPIMDGLQFVDAVRQDQRLRKLPLLMISSEAEKSRVANAMRHGVDQYLVKPCTIRTVASKLEAMGLEIPEGMKSSGAKQSSREKEAKSVRDSSRASVGVPRSTGPIRVLLVDDSSLVRRVLKATLEACEGFEVVGAARDGLEGLELAEQVGPEVILLDVDMPRMDGLEMLKQLRDRKHSVPVVMFSSRTERGAKTATDALLLGAKDFVFKPGGANMQDLAAGQAAIANEIVPRLRWLTRRHVKGGVQQRSATKPQAKKSVASNPEFASRDSGTRIDLVVIAASTGGPATLATLSKDPRLRGELGVPIVIAQHMPAMFTKHLAGRLAKDSGIDIAEARDGEVLTAGMIRLAPGGRHAAVKTQGLDLLTVVHDGPPVNSCRPSADVLFLSAADSLQQNLLAVVLTGMGSDAREGCRAIRKAGGVVWAQDEATSVIWGMPGSVVKAGLAHQVLPIDRIGSEIARRVRVGRDD